MINFINTNKLNKERKSHSRCTMSNEMVMVRVKGKRKEAKKRNEGKKEKQTGGL